VINRQDLEQRQLSAISEILRDVPGVAVNRGGVVGSTTQIRIRGAEGNQVLVFIDGVEVNDLAQGSEFNFAHLSTSEIERVELIRGPQSALWGSDALAGVINISTKRGAGAIKISGFAEAGSFGSKYSGGSISGGADHYHFNVAGSYLKSTGDNISRVNDEDDEDDGYENGSFSLTGGYSPLNNLSFEFSSRFTEASNDFDETDFAVTGLPSDSNSETKTSQNYSRLQMKLSLYDDRWKHKFGVAIVNTDNDNFGNGVETSSTQGKKNKFDYQTSLFLHTEQILPADHILTFVIEHENEDFTQRGSIEFGNDPNQDIETDSTAYVGEYRVTFSEKLSLSGSVRHDDNSDFQNATTCRGTAAYNLHDHDMRIHASYGTGVKNPTFTERFGFFASSLFFPFRGNPDLKPEKSHGWEIGIEKSFLDDKLNLGLTYFNEKLLDEINGFFFDLTTFTTTAINENGASRREGIELVSHLTVGQNLSFSGNFTYLDATQPDGFGGFEKEVRRPSYIANVNSNYSFRDKRANINVNINYNGEQDDFFFPPPLFTRNTVALDDFVLVDIAASYKINDTFSVYGRVENLLDEKYEEVLGFQGMGLGAFAGIRVNIIP
jgi:vitamin B12 transporter